MMHWDNYVDIDVLVFFFLVVLSYDDWTKEKTRLAILGLISLARIRQENVVL